MNIHQLNVLIRELAQTLASVAHLAFTLRDQNRDEATTDEFTPLDNHMDRCTMALSGVDPNAPGAETSTASEPDVVNPSAPDTDETARSETHSTFQAGVARSKRRK
jgi:hypothetical protein